MGGRAFFVATKNPVNIYIYLDLLSDVRTTTRGDPLRHMGVANIYVIADEHTAVRLLIESDRK